MKTLRNLLVVVMLSIAGMTWAQASFLSVLNNQKDITAVTLNKFMLSAVANEGDSAGMAGGDILKKLDNMCVYTSETASGAKKIDNVFKNDIMTIPGIQTVMDVNSDDSIVKMLGVPCGDNAYCETYMYVNSSPTIVLIAFIGKLTPADFAEIMSNGMVGF